jgi:mannitol/fructose-specific phosphotransferase system IIA component (Ntr-type)
MTALEKLLPPERIIEIEAADKDGALRELSGLIARAPGLLGPEALLQAMIEREELMPTGIGAGIAIPHCKHPRIKNFAVSLGRAKTPLDWGGGDGQPVRIVAMIAAPDSRQDDYLRLLSRVTKFLKTEREKLLEIPNVKDIHAIVHRY